MASRLKNRDFQLARAGRWCCCAITRSASGRTRRTIRLCDYRRAGGRLPAKLTRLRLAIMIARLVQVFSVSDQLGKLLNACPIRNELIRGAARPIYDDRT